MKNIISILAVLAVASKASFGQSVAYESSLDERKPIKSCRPGCPFGPSGCRYKRIQGKECGLRGCLSDPAPLGGPLTLTSLLACVDACFNTPSCTTLGWTSPPGSCQLYSQSIFTMGFASINTNTVFYSTACFNQTCECQNQGVEYAVYRDPGGISPFDLSQFDNIGGAVTSDLGLPAGGNGGASDITVYGSTYTNSEGDNYFTVNHQAYLHAPVTGTYQFVIDPIDDGLWIWIGNFAYSGWLFSGPSTTGNYDFNTGHADTTQTLSFYACKGQYVPFRVVFYQYCCPWYFPIKLVGPGSTGTLLDSNTSYSNSIVRGSCDGTTAPFFPPFPSNESSTATARRMFKLGKTHR